MGLLDIFKKNKKIYSDQINNKFVSDLKYNNVNIVIEFDIEESKDHILEDYKVLEKDGIEKIIKNQFIPWIKGDDYKDRDDDKIYEGLNIYYISYEYSKIIDKYSPTGEENYFGKFLFGFESTSDYTSDILESVEMEVYVLNGRIVKVCGFDT